MLFHHFESVRRLAPQLKCPGWLLGCGDEFFLPVFVWRGDRHRGRPGGLGEGETCAGDAPGYRGGVSGFRGNPRADHAGREWQTEFFQALPRRVTPGAAQRDCESPVGLVVGQDAPVSWLTLAGRFRRIDHLDAMSCKLVTVAFPWVGEFLVLVQADDLGAQVTENNDGAASAPDAA